MSAEMTIWWIPFDLALCDMQPFAPVDPFAKNKYKRDALGNPIMEEPQYSRLPKDWRETGYLKNGIPSKKKGTTAARASSDASAAVR